MQECFLDLRNSKWILNLRVRRFGLLRLVMLVIVRLVRWSFEQVWFSLEIKFNNPRIDVQYWTDIRIEFNGHTNFKFESIYKIMDLKITILLTCNLYIHLNWIIDINITFQKHFTWNLFIINFLHISHSRQMMNNGRIYVLSSGTLFPCCVS